MPFIALRCPQCGAEIQLDNTREFGFCNYCGTKILQDKQIIEKRVVYDHSKDIENNVQLGYRYFNNKEYKKAYQCFEKVLGWDVNNADANKMLDVLSNRKNTPNLYLRLNTTFYFSLKILLDGALVGKLSSSHPVYLNVSPGKHSLTFIRNKQKPNVLDININNDFDKISVVFTPVLLSNNKLNYHIERY